MSLLTTLIAVWLLVYDCNELNIPIQLSCIRKFTFFVIDENWMVY